MLEHQQNSVMEHQQHSVINILTQASDLLSLSMGKRAVVEMLYILFIFFLFNLFLFIFFFFFLHFILFFLFLWGQVGGGGWESI